MAVLNGNKAPQLRVGVGVSGLCVDSKIRLLTRDGGGCETPQRPTHVQERRV